MRGPIVLSLAGSLLLSSVVLAQTQRAQAAAATGDRRTAPQSINRPALAPAAPDGTGPIETDRPDFTEASSLVPRGRAQLEMGFTYSRNTDDGVLSAQAYPEALLRIGMLAPWFEARIAQSVSSVRISTGSGKTQTIRGADDLYIGAKLALAAQSGRRPELALVLQSTLPTGVRDIGARGALPGANLLYGWDVVPDRVTIGGSTQANAAESDAGARYAEVAQSVTVGYNFTPRFGSYAEAFSIVPVGRVASDQAATHYVNGGLRFLLTSDLQCDVRVGRGLTRASDDYFVGAGFAIRR